MVNLSIDTDKHTYTHTQTHTYICIHTHTTLITKYEFIVVIDHGRDSSMQYLWECLYTNYLPNSVK